MRSNAKSIARRIRSGRGTVTDVKSPSGATHPRPPSIDQYGRKTHAHEQEAGSVRVDRQVVGTEVRQRRRPLHDRRRDR